MIRIASKLVALPVAAALFAQPVVAGPFDCSVVYDEYDSFMNKNYLIKPDAYVRIVQGRITQAQTAGQANALLLSPQRLGMGAAIVQTNKNAYGKFLFSWSGRGDLRGTPLLILRDITTYKSVQDGNGRRNYREIRVSASQMIDLDTGRATQGQGADIRYNASNPKEVVLEAINGAKIAFPMETSCRQ
ncbi:MAG: hypothetical protein MPJ78_14400 [Hyphomicrobiaceae bacterium]|nr:hypothetical protein [Hyphomicrobiaceae bacterium]